MEQLALFDELTLDGKIQRSIDVIKLAAEMSEQYYGKPLLVCYSGGKDSDVLLDLVKRSGVPFEIQHGLTTVDAPPTVQHVKKVFRDLEEHGIHTEIIKGTYKGKETTMWRLIEEKKLPPTRLIRYCCQVFKETATPNRFVCLGVRRAESTNRATRKEFEVRALQTATALRYDFNHVLENFNFAQEHAGEENADVWDCKIISNAKANNDVITNPIIYWLDSDIWEYVETYNVEMNPLYSMGYSRVGCVGCPMATAKTREKEFEDFPQYKDNYIKAFDKMIEHRKESGLSCEWKDGADCFEWWLYGNERKDEKQIEGQETLFD